MFVQNSCDRGCVLFHSPRLGLFWVWLDRIARVTHRSFGLVRPRAGVIALAYLMIAVVDLDILVHVVVDVDVDVDVDAGFAFLIEGFKI